MKTRVARRPTAILVIALAAIAALAEPAAAEGAYPRRSLGIVYAAEGYGEGSSVAPGEILAVGLALEPFRWKAFVPSFSALALVPVFPLDAGATMFEARIDLRLFSLGGEALDRIARERALYTPALSASAILPPDGPAFYAVGARPLVLRMGDGVYSILSPAWLLDWDGGLESRGWSIELFEFTHFLF
jgi:hypothetical protein